MSKPQDLDLSDEALQEIVGDLRAWNRDYPARIITALAEQRKALLKECDSCPNRGHVDNYVIRRILGVKP